MINQFRSQNLIVVDTETTGASPFEHDILTAAFVGMQSRNELVVHVSLDANSIWTDYGLALFKNFESEWSASAVPASEAVNMIERFLKDEFAGQDAILVGHNVSFDRFFLLKLAQRAGKEKITGISHRSVDTHSLLMLLNLMGVMDENALTSDGAFQAFGAVVPSRARHTAIGDARATKQLFLGLIEKYESHFAHSAV